MIKTIDVVALGELLVDFTPVGLGVHGNPCFEQNPGGAPANVLVCISRLGGKTVFIGKVGDDSFGRYLGGVLVSCSVDTAGLCYSKTVPTTLAFVQLDARGDRSFSFYRNPGADTTLDKKEIDYTLIDKTRIFHYGSLSLTDEPSRRATFSALKHARKMGCIISYDPNLRPLLWKNLDEAKKRICSAMKYADIVKVSEEELEFIADEKDMDIAARMLSDMYDITLLIVTRGAKGSFFYFDGMTGYHDALNSAEIVDTTGAGDAFLGGFLYSLRRCGVDTLERLTREIVEESMQFAGAVAMLCCTQKGAIPAMPQLSDVENLLANT